MDIAELKSTQSFLAEQMAEAKDGLLKKIIQQCLSKTEVTSDDAKRFQIVTHLRYPGREFIGFEGNMIGEIKFYVREENFQNTCVWEFEPRTMID